MRIKPFLMTVNCPGKFKDTSWQEALTNPSIMQDWESRVGGPCLAAL